MLVAQIFFKFSIIFSSNSFIKDQSSKWLINCESKSVGLLKITLNWIDDDVYNGVGIGYDENKLNNNTNSWWPDWPICVEHCVQ